DAEQALPIWVDPGDETAVLRAVGNFVADVERVTGVLPALLDDSVDLPSELVIVGVLDSNRLLKQMEEAGAIDFSEIRGRWEAHQVELVEDPLPGVKRALVIAGSDRRGAAYGLYRLSAAIGVSPW